MMWNSESPFYIKPRLNRELFDWGLKFIRACRPEHVRESAPLLLALNIASKQLFETFDAMPDMDFGSRNEDWSTCAAPRNDWMRRPNSQPAHANSEWAPRY